MPCHMAHHVPVEHQNKGYGTQAIQEIIRLAGESGKYDFLILDYREACVREAGLSPYRGNEQRRSGNAAESVKRPVYRRRFTGTDIAGAGGGLSLQCMEIAI